MTREEMMERARVEINQVVALKQNRLMNLVEQAWAEGKRHAEIEALAEIMQDAIKSVKGQEVQREVGL